ncbi:testicular haploid expressed gene protein isoform X2 [Heterocephalus glaber]|uniref:Testicular haploid expressed gene protein isoform X2 n=1 Tax=Heterocephalus glaber TaxID=10181 RepID=A0AAX6Q2J6_HETGA|nr:testicular haploid expressed gene protein isoform X2 [Heterocephalus glaber]
MGERWQSLRQTHLVPEAGGRSEEEPENGEQHGQQNTEAMPGPRDPEEEASLWEVAGEWHLGALDPKEVLVEPELALDQDLEADITMSRLSVTKRRPNTPTARGRRRQRLQELAKPKTDWWVVRDRLGYCCKGFVWIFSRRNDLPFCLYWPSVYWTKRFLEDTTLSVTVPAVSLRLEELARPRRLYLEYFNSCRNGCRAKPWHAQGLPFPHSRLGWLSTVATPRASPLWPVPRPTLEYCVSGRLKELATPRVRNNIWSINMSEVSRVSRAAQMAVPSSRILQLAKPRAPATLSAEWDPMPKPKPYVSDYSRLLQLALPKAQSEKCVPDRSPRWEVLDITKKAVASPRIVSLAQPRVRKGLSEGYNPSYISPASLVARASPRLYELATPKSITKKV